MRGKVYGDECRTTMICIDSYDEGIIAGRLYNPSFEGSKSFHGLTRLLIQMEDMLDEMLLPQSFTATRTFASVSPRYKSGAPPGGESEGGKLATFAVRILFRQNASWQGSVTWIEGGQSQSFRSALELIFLMNSALDQNDALFTPSLAPA